MLISAIQQREWDSLSIYHLFFGFPFHLGHQWILNRVLHFCVSMSVLHISSSTPFFPYIPHLCVNIYAFLFLTYFALYDTLYVHPYVYEWPSSIPCYSLAKSHCVVGRGCLLWPVRSLGKTLLAFILLHSVFQGQLFLLLPGVSWLPAFAFQSPVMKRTSFWGC